MSKSKTTNKKVYDFLCKTFERLHKEMERSDVVMFNELRCGIVYAEDYDKNAHLRTIFSVASSMVFNNSTISFETDNFKCKFNVSRLPHYIRVFRRLSYTKDKLKISNGGNVVRHFLLNESNVGRLLGKKIKWSAPAYQTNKNYGGTALITGIDFTKHYPLDVKVIDGDVLHYAFLNNVGYDNAGVVDDNAPKAFCFSDLDRCISVESVE